MVNLKKLAVIDCETDPFEHGIIPKPFIWGFYDGYNYSEFFNTEKLATMLKENNFIVYAHNGGKFDFFYLIKYMDKFKPIRIINNRLVSIPFGNSTLRDSYAIIPTALATFEKMKFDYCKLHKSVRKKYMSEIRRYLKSDCVNLFNLVTAFVQKYGRKITLASTSVDEVCRIEQIDKCILHAPKSIYERIRPYYRGGQVSVFKTGIITNTTYIYDINSAYPFAMKHYHPIGDNYTITSKPKYVRDEAFYQTVDNKFYTGHEINVLEVPVIKEIYFKQNIHFSKFVDYYYDMKKKATKHSTDYIFAKLLLNSFYGKLASNPDNYYDYTMMPAKYIRAAGEVDSYELYSIIDNTAIMRKPINDKKKKWFNLATAASITGFVRAMLNRQIRQIIQHGCEVYYCDTDSIITNCEHLHTGIELGEWKLEQVNDKLVIIAPKLYAARNAKTGKYKIASKGVELSAQEIISLAKGKDVIYNRDAPTYSIANEPHFITRRLKGLVDKSGVAS